MRKLLIVVALGLPSLARAATWTLDPAHTSVQFSVRHLMVSTVRGAFGKLTGTVQVDEKDLTRSKIQATIDAASIDTRIEKRDAHLKSPDFLDVAKYPTITFVSKKIEQVIFQMNLSFARALDAAAVPYGKDFYLGGYHGWPYWERELHWALPRILPLIERAER